jgi:hypothetical protein
MLANLKDLIDDGVMKYDGYEGTMFGILGGALTVVGWNGKRGNPKKYILTCSICSSDTELHGEGYFAMAKGHLISGYLPCGCSNKCNWTEEQYKVRMRRACSEKGIIFKGWSSKFTTANKTTVLVECPDHGEYKGLPISFFLTKDLPKGCAGCFAIRQGNYKRKDDQVMIDKFLSTGCYAEGTTFRRSDRLDKHGHKKYWFINCSECGTEGEGHLVGLYKGVRSCSCNYNRPQETYIHLLKDGDNVVAIKFGVANYSPTRIKQQQNLCVYTLESYGVWHYPDVTSCMDAERQCKHTLSCGVVSKQEMRDGYTETTSAHNIEKVIAIFESFGGARKS